jgi:hypothetical protein
MSPEAVELGKTIVRFHDESGFPYQMALATAREAGQRVALLGIILESTARKLSRKLTLEICQEWQRLFEPTELEKTALLKLQTTCEG